MPTDGSRDEENSTRGCGELLGLDKLVDGMDWLIPRTTTSLDQQLRISSPNFDLLSTDDTVLRDAFFLPCTSSQSKASSLT
jgi:hypothetical protein